MEVITGAKTHSEDDLENSPNDTVQSVARDMRNSWDTNEGSSIRSSLTKVFSIFDETGPLKHIISHQSFQFSDFAQSPHTLYIIGSPERLKTYAPIMRVLFSQAFRDLSIPKSERQTETLFIMDEAGNLGKMEQLPSILSFGATYVSVMHIWQSIEQIDELYPREGKTMISGSRAQVYVKVDSTQQARDLELGLNGTKVQKPPLA